MISESTPFLIKTFGADLKDFRFVRLPSVVEKARQAFVDEDVLGFLICALVRPPRLTGLMFCERSLRIPQGLPIRTGAITDRCLARGYQLFVTEGRARWVVAHWLHENGEIGPFYSIQ